MDELKQYVDQFERRGLDELKKKHEDAVSSVKNIVNELNRFVGDRLDSVAFSDWKIPDKIPSSVIDPPYLKYGQFQLVDDKDNPIEGVQLPLLLPTKNINAVLFDLGDDNEKVPGLFQVLFARLLLTVRMNLIKVSIVDRDFGRSFPFVTTITNPMLKSQILDRQDDVSKLITDLAKETSEANRNFMGRYPDIDTYNANAGEMANPYHYVFIDDFPDGFTPQSLDGLKRLIDNGNAARVGIKLFINYSKKTPAPRDFDIQPFVDSCSCVIANENSRIEYLNWPIQLPANIITNLDFELPPQANTIASFINNIRPKSVTYSLDGWIEDLKNNDLIWKGDTCDGIKVPIGYITPTKTFDFYIANDNDTNCKDFFALVAGMPGYGKTVLLHNIIVNAAMKYSPDELCLYLADFAEGASFSIYRDLPHVKSLMLSNNKEYALRMLEDLSKEAKERSFLYQRAQRQYGKQVTNLATYRVLTGEKLPRIVFVMDEFHTLFLSTDATTIRAKEELCNGIRQWRKFGISIILCTQSISGVSFGNADTYITYRFALNLLEMDSKTVIRNGAAKHLTRKGQTLMNNSADGREDLNIEFQSAYSQHYLDHVNYLASLYQEIHEKKHVPFICEAGTDADICENEILSENLKKDSFVCNHQYCDVYVGKPDLLRATHTRIRYRRQLNSNTLIFGDDYRTLVYDVMLQLIQLKEQSHPNSKFYVVDCFNAGDAYQGALKGMDMLSDNYIVCSSHNIVQCVNELSEEMERRKAEQREGRMTEERKVLVILNAENCYDLRPQQGKFGAEQSQITKKLIPLIEEGAPLGIHCIVHALSYNTMFGNNGILSSREFPAFENLILLKGADVGNMMLSGLKLNSPEEVGQMIVINARVDAERYEQCNAYSDNTIVENKPNLDFISNIFKQYRYA